MTFSEKAMLAIIDLQALHGMNFFEAASEFCKVTDIDPVDFAKRIDRVILDRLQCCAMEERMLQQKYVSSYVIN